MQNPFTPNSRVKDPTKFAGRLLHIRNAYDYVQSGRHIMIAGGKGVGKTSLSNQLKLLLCGDTEAAYRFNIDTKKSPPRLTVYIAIESSPKDALLPRIVNLLEEATCIRPQMIKRTSKIQFGIKGFISSESTDELIESENSNVVDAFIKSIKRIHSQHEPLRENGAVIVIDEVDASIENDRKWGVWLKSLIETLQNENLDHITFVLIGSQWSHSALLKQHASLRRLIEPVFLPDMTDHEIAELCLRALGDTNVIFSRELILEIANLSNGHPYSAHLMGSALFKKALDEGRVYSKSEAIRYQSLLEAQPASGFDIKIKLIDLRSKRGPFDMLPFHLRQVINQLVETVYASEYNEFNLLIADPAASKILEAAALYDKRQFSIAELEALTRLPEKALRKSTCKLIKCEALKQSDLNVFEFSDPLLKLRIRLISEYQKHKALAIINKEMSDQVREPVASKQVPTPPTDDELVARKAELAQFIVHEHTQKTASKNAESNH